MRRCLCDGQFYRVSTVGLLVILLLAALTFAEPVEAQDSATPAPSGTPSPQPTPTAATSVQEVSTTTVGNLQALSWQDVVGVLVSVVVILLVAYYGGKLLVFLSKRLVRRTESAVDDELIDVIEPQVSWLILAMGFQFATNRLDFLGEGIKNVLQTVYFLLYLFVFTVTIWRISDYAVDRYINTNRHKLNETLVDQIVPLTKRLFHIVLLFVSGAILAGQFGINVLAIASALGLSGLAIALAAKDTITNIISGLVLMVSQPFSIGDRVEVFTLDTWGDVVAIGIRSTTVVTRDNRLVIVPNSVIVDDTVVNYSRPDSRYRLQTDIGIGCSVDIPAVTEMLRETVREQEGVLPDKPVDVLFTEFADSSNTFRVRWWVASYAEKRSSIDRISTAIQELATRESIDMPNPIYSLENKVFLNDDDAIKAAQKLHD